MPKKKKKGTFTNRTSYLMSIKSISAKQGINISCLFPQVPSANINMRGLFAKLQLTTINTTYDP